LTDVKLKITRSSILLGGGLIAFFFEMLKPILFGKEPAWLIVGGALSMMGLELVRRADAHNGKPSS
jgi:hypothetical protein